MWITILIIIEMTLHTVWIVIAAVMACVVLSAYGQEVQMHTDREIYTSGEPIVVWGVVDTVLPGEQIRLQVQMANSGTLVQVAQFEVAKDGTYTYVMNADNLENEGRYIIRIWYGSESDITEIGFEPDSGGQMQNYEVADGRGGTFDVGYTISGGTINDMRVNYEGLAIDVELSAHRDGTIGLALPRQYIDASEEGVDVDYIIQVDGRITHHTEEAIGDIRQVEVAFPANATHITITGTSVVPEFGIAMLLLAGGMTAVLVRARTFL